MVVQLLVLVVVEYAFAVAHAIIPLRTVPTKPTMAVCPLPLASCATVLGIWHRRVPTMNMAYSSTAARVGFASPPNTAPRRVHSRIIQRTTRRRKRTRRRRRELSTMKTLVIFCWSVKNPQTHTTTLQNPLSTKNSISVLSNSNIFTDQKVCQVSTHPNHFFFRRYYRPELFLRPEGPTWTGVGSRPQTVWMRCSPS
jgi:hypothetical protein